ncbi:MAG: energy transducer TonB [Gemmatimonadaceae bacterium]
MCLRIRWSSVVVRSPTLLVMLLGAACGVGRGLSARYDDLDRTSLVRGAACDRSDQDTTHYLHLPLYRACAVTIAARRLANDLRPEFVPQGRDQNCFSAVIVLAVDTLGRPDLRTTRLVRASDPAFGAEVLAIVAGLRFQPAQLGGRRVRQLYELREVLRVQRGRWMDGTGTGGQRQRGSSTRTASTTSPAPSMSVSEAPSGADLPSLQNLGPVC